MDQVNEATDLVLDRVLNAPIDRVWDAWTDAEKLKQWWCPRPWTTPEAVIELRPGGRFFTRLVWTGALSAGFRPNPGATSCGEGGPSLMFTAIITFADAGDGRTRYRAHVMHLDAEGRDAHDKMGFHEGWGTAASQLEAFAAA